ncbi:tetratricopeptide repeat protein [Echinicola salinicaeni]|uniref:tetratricopeptide repeat protein n=1 Tax=Echinicola salinicaeni TaxID=2762757 RepID=UPI001646D8B8|nr:tetratricopeptide repeat protein [Echinicola salinicaeni]
MKNLATFLLLLLFTSCQGNFEKANQYYSNQQFEDAISELNWLLFIKMSDIRAIQLRAMSHEALEEYEKALTDYKRILQLSPHDPQALSGMGKVYWELEEYKQAEKHFLLAAKEDPKNVELLIMLGRAMIKNENYKSAEDFLFEAKELDPKNAAIYFYRGIVQAHLGDAWTAASQFNMYIMYSGDNMTAFYNRGLAYMRMGMTDWATEDFDRVLKSQPKHYNALARRAICQMEFNPSQSCRDLRLAAKHGSEFAKENLNKCF